MTENAAQPSEKTGLEFNIVNEPERIAELANFAQDIFREHFLHIHTPEKVEYLVNMMLSIETLIRTIADEGYEYYFVDDEGEHVGFLAVVPHEDCLFLSKLYVQKDHRGKGYASKMMAFVKQRAQEVGRNKVQLTCARDNESSLAVYDHMGFKRVASTDTEVGEGIFMRDYVLELSL